MIDDKQQALKDPLTPHQVVAFYISLLPRHRLKHTPPHQYHHAPKHDHPRVVHVGHVVLSYSASEK